MGNNCSSIQVNKEIENEFMDYLKSNNLKAFIQRIQKDSNFSQKIQNSSRFPSDYGHTNALGISFLENKPQFIKLLMNQPSLFGEMMISFHKSKFSLMNYLCEKDYLNCIKIIINQTDYESLLSRNINKIKSISFNSSLIETFIPEYAIITAANFGSIKTIDYFYKNFSRLNDPPEDFSFKTCDNKGENIELIACRTGNFLLVKYLYKCCKAKFDKINYNGENALIVCLSGVNENNKNHFCVFKYLIEVLRWRTI